MRGIEIFLAFAAVCSAVAPHEGSSLLQVESKMVSQKLSPVQKVVAMLEDMHANLKKEYEEDENMFKKIACWCHDNKLDKKFAIEDGEAEAARLRDAIAAGEGKQKELETNIAALKKEIADETEALEKAQAVRDKQNAEFRKIDNECSVNSKALSAAILVLGKHFQKSDKSETQQLKDNFEYSGLKGPIGGSFMQSRAMKPEAIAVVQGIVSKSFDADTTKKVVTALQQSPFGDYSSQSGEILGILKQMEEEMGKDCAQAREEETRRAEEFAELKAAKEEIIAKAKDTLKAKETQLSETLEKLAEDRISLGDVEKQLVADKEFMATVEKQCTDTDGQWEERKKARMEEMTAVQETIEILTSDAARDTFHKTQGHGKSAEQEAKEAAEAERGAGASFTVPEDFLQMYNARERAASLLRRVARSSKDEALLTLAATVKLDAFTKVKAAIDNMIAMLKQEMEDEVKHKDYCTSNIQENENNQADNARAIELKNREIADTEEAIKQLHADIEKLQKDIAEAEVELQKAGENRVQESKDFQTTMADQQATQKVIRMALDRMVKFYNSFVEQNPVEAPQAPGKLQAYKKSGASSPVISMLRDLITDAKRVQTDAKAEEQKAWDEYKQYVDDSNAAITDMENTVVNKQKELADKDKLLIEQKGDLDDLVEEKGGLEEVNKDLHGQCDFILNNFDTRQQARSEEIEALGEAMGILSGALKGQ